MKTYIIILFAFLSSFSLSAQKAQVKGETPTRSVAPLSLSSPTLQNIIAEKMRGLQRNEAKVDSLAYQRITKQYHEVQVLHNGIYTEVAQRVAASHLWEKAPEKKDPKLMDDLRYATARANQLSTEIDQLLSSSGVQPMTAKKFPGAEILAGATLFIHIYKKLETKIQCLRAADYYRTTYWLSLKEIETGRPNDINWPMVLGNDCAEIIERKLAKASRK